MDDTVTVPLKFGADLAGTVVLIPSSGLGREKGIWRERFLLSRQHQITNIAHLNTPLKKVKNRIPKIPVIPNIRKKSEKHFFILIFL